MNVQCKSCGNKVPWHEVTPTGSELLCEECFERKKTVI